MTIEIRSEDHLALAAYASIPIAFEVREVLDLAALESTPMSLRVRSVTPRIKDYDALPQNDPWSWPARFDVSRWIFLSAYAESGRVGGAVVLSERADVTRLGGRPGSGLLWDLRVAPSWRRRGVGRTLLAAAEVAVRSAGVHRLDAETQDTNVAACRLYAASGYELVEIAPRGYDEVIDEARLLWTKLLV